jgi:hypothetical protein
LVDHLKGCAVKFIGLLFRVRDGDRCCLDAGEVLEAKLLGVGRDHPFVLAG